MIKNLEVYDRVYEEANFVIENKATVRHTANNLGVSKSTVHKDLTKVLPEISFVLSEQVRTVLDQNKAERHIRGGEATKQKYLKKTTNR